MPWWPVCNSRISQLELRCRNPSVISHSVLTIPQQLMITVLLCQATFLCLGTSLDWQLRTSSQHALSCCWCCLISSSLQCVLLLADFAICQLNLNTSLFSFKLQRFSCLVCQASCNRHTDKQTYRHTDRRTDKRSTVTLAAHAHQGLTTSYYRTISIMLLRESNGTCVCYFSGYETKE